MNVFWLAPTGAVAFAIGLWTAGLVLPVPDKNLGSGMLDDNDRDASVR